MTYLYFIANGKAHDNEDDDWYKVHKHGPIQRQARVGSVNGTQHE